jgi:hypothetical protein
MSRSQQMSANSEKILDSTVYGQESLRLSLRFESVHLPLSLSRGLVRNFGAIVGVTPGVVSNVVRDSCAGSSKARVRVTPACATTTVIPVLTD